MSGIGDLRVGLDEKALAAELLRSGLVELLVVVAAAAALLHDALDREIGAVLLQDLPRAILPLRRQDVDVAARLRKNAGVVVAASRLARGVPVPADSAPAHPLGLKVVRHAFGAGKLPLEPI